MAQIDWEVFSRVISESGDVRPAVLRRVIELISAKYAASIKKEEPINFKAIRDEVLEYCDLWDLFIIGPYKSAVGKYYSLKKQKEAGQKYEVGEVFSANKNSVLIAASPDVKILFQTSKACGKLLFTDIDTGQTRFCLSNKGSKVTEKQYLKAKIKALAVMNSRRQF